MEKYELQVTQNEPMGKYELLVIPNGSPAEKESSRKLISTVIKVTLAIVTLIVLIVVTLSISAICIYKQELKKSFNEFPNNGFERVFNYSANIDADKTSTINTTNTTKSTLTTTTYYTTTSKITSKTTTTKGTTTTTETTTTIADQVSTTSESQEEQTTTITTEVACPEWNGEVLTRNNGRVQGPSGQETYYNLPMDGVVSMMRNMGFDGESYPYWVREDGVKMLGPYVMCAANLELRPRGSLVQSSLGMALVCDTGGFAYKNREQLDIAVSW